MRLRLDGCTLPPSVGENRSTALWSVSSFCRIGFGNGPTIYAGEI